MGKYWVSKKTKQPSSSTWMVGYKRVAYMGCSGVTITIYKTNTKITSCPITYRMFLVFKIWEKPWQGWMCLGTFVTKETAWLHWNHWINFPCAFLTLLELSRGHLLRWSVFFPASWLDLPTILGSRIIIPAPPWWQALQFCSDQGVWQR